MKKKAIFETLIIGMTIAMTVYFTGCFTSAKAYTKSTTPDGVVTESYVSVTGTGDKTSQMAAEGMFADGTVEDLGAGLKNANASQQSTGIDGTMKGMVSMMSMFIQGMEAYQGRVPSVKPQVKPPVDTRPGVAITRPIPQPKAPRSTVSGEGVPEIVIFGNRDTCGRCSRLWEDLDVLAMSEAACGASITDADATDNNAVYEARKPRGGFAYPYVAVYVDGKLVDGYEAGNMSAEDIAERAKKTIGECEDIAE